uniref:Uncharacterized protein n=1 Tax=Globisporangium ultimum (strain ATCC 200006 / CBS 805.95 / DAOM BR144) TaxID=431595 RepID=K3WLY4_GLOUD
MVHVKIRVFTFPSNPREQNSYVVGTFEGGLLPTVGTLKLEEDEFVAITFAQLRPRIELQNDNFMIRSVVALEVLRSLMFQEVLTIISTSPNPHNWPHSALQTYWFGYFDDVEQLVPTMLPARETPVADEDTPISNFLNMTTSKQTGDLILIPQTQVGPMCEKCCQGCARCPPVRKQ